MKQPDASPVLDILVFVRMIIVGNEGRSHKKFGALLVHRLFLSYHRYYYYHLVTWVVVKK